MTRVVVVGSVNLDLVVTAPHIPAPGETILGSELVYRPGGKGGNQAVAARRLGAETTLVAATGDDRTGADLRRTLAEEGLDVSQIVVAGGVATGVALIVVDGNGENSIVVAPGANRLLDQATVADLATSMNRSDVLSLQIEVPLTTSLEAATIAQEAGATVLLNAAPLPSVPDSRLARLLGAVDVVVVNEGEALQLLKEEPAADVSGWARLAARLCELGPRSAVITLGARGAVAAEDAQVHAQPAFAVDVVDTTGAGDSFSGALAVALAEGRPIADGLQRACAAGALATTKLGAQEALPTLAELERFLEGTEGAA